MRLIQIPFSHNCVKVLRALELKGLTFEVQDIPPVDRRPVRSASGQGLVPVLVDGSRAITDSTAILLHLEETYPERPLLPADPVLRTECLLLEDWADEAFMERSRRLIYWSVLSQPGRLESLFFPGESGLAQRLKGRVARRAVRRRFGLSPARNARDETEARRQAGLAVARVAGRPFLVGDAVTIADVTLAAMSAPLAGAASLVRNDPDVRELLAWGRGILGEGAPRYGPAG